MNKSKAKLPVKIEEDEFEWRRRYRPRTLDQVVGNEDAVKMLKSMLERNRVPHCLLFSGGYGTGKTSLARIMRKEMGCARTDYTEVTASTVTGVDSVREIARSMHMRPGGGSCRIWFLDECHLYSTQARNALLVPTENAPKHVYFFLGTTEPSSLNQGVRSRFTEIETEPLSEEDMRKLVNRVAKKELFELSESEIKALVHAADGCARMALNMLEKASTLPSERRIKMFKLYSDKAFEGIDLCRALLGHKFWPEVSAILRGLKGDPDSIRRQALAYATKCLLAPKPDLRAFSVIASLEKNLYDSGMAGLVGGCFEIITVNKK